MPDFIQRLYGGVVWRLPNKEQTSKTIYLTFDDGPIPEVTPKVLEILRKENVHATFFMVGDNIRKYPDLCKQVLQQGHQVGNHTFNHLKGTHTPYEQYAQNISQTDTLLDSLHPEGNRRKHLLRPPYGKMTFRQKRELQKTHTIILWDIITHDYNRDYTPEKVLQVVKKYSRNGSIVVFHDSMKASKNMLAVLPQAISYWKTMGYQFCVIK